MLSRKVVACAAAVVFLAARAGPIVAGEGGDERQGRPITIVASPALLPVGTSCEIRLIPMADGPSATRAVS